jgi:hypothetical protein
MRLITIIAMLIFLIPRGHAKEAYFDYAPQSGTNLDGELNVSFFYAIEGANEDRFRVKPILDGQLYIWNDDWVSSTSYWGDFPKLSDELRLRYPIQFDTSELHFQIQDVQTAIIYETPKHKIIGRYWFVDYVRKLNEQIFKVVEYSSESF